MCGEKGRGDNVYSSEHLALVPFKTFIFIIPPLSPASSTAVAEGNRLWSDFEDGERLRHKLAKNSQLVSREVQADTYDLSEIFA